MATSSFGNLSGLEANHRPADSGWLRPKRLYPIFRDREELAASAELRAEVNEALVQSRYLVVVCSPNAAKSIWVNEEIKFFKKLGREDRVLALIAAGEPNAAEGKPGFTGEDECFPEALRYQFSSNGGVLPVRIEPVAGDARQDKDAKRTPNSRCWRAYWASISTPSDSSRK